MRQEMPPASLLLAMPALFDTFKTLIDRSSLDPEHLSDRL
jgi:hypothetical protein